MNGTIGKKFTKNQGLLYKVLKILETMDGLVSRSAKDVVNIWILAWTEHKV